MKNITPLQPGSVGPTLGPLKPGVYGLCSKAELSRGHSGLWLGEHKPRKATQSRSTALPLALQSRRHVQHDNPTDQPALLRLWNSPGHKTGVGSPSLLQGIFPIQGSDPGLPQVGVLFSWATREPLTLTQRDKIQLFSQSPVQLRDPIYCSSPGFWPSSQTQVPWARALCRHPAPG